MKSYKLSFGTIKILKNNLAEIIVGEGVELDEVSVAEYHDFLLDHLEKPMYLLINKEKPYTYNFNAQMALASLEGVRAKAMVVYTSAAFMATQTVINMNKKAYANTQVFQERDAALSWLNSLLSSQTL